MTEEQSAPSGESSAEGEGQKKSALAQLPGILTDTTGKLAPVIEMLKSFGMESAAKPLEVLVETLNGGAGRLQAVVDAVAANEENGAVGQVLGGAVALLGESTGGDGFLDKLRETVGAASDIWNNYYEQLFDQDGKLNTEKAKNLALEVGDTILGAKKMAKVRKALAIGNVIRNTAEAVMEAAKSAPFPANLVPIGKAIALGAVQLSTVKGQAHGGLSKVPSTGTYLLERGERVVGSRLNADLASFLSGQRGEPGLAPSSDYSRTSSVHNSPTINLTINGDARGDAVRSNRNSMEAMIRSVFADHAMAAPFA